MQMVFRDLDQAFICTSEIGLDSFQNGTGGSNFGLSKDFSGHQAIQENGPGKKTETLEALHEKLMFLARYERYPEALVVIQRMMDLVTRELGISRDASKLNTSHVGHAVMKSMSLFRFHLLLLKTEAYLHSQTGNLELAKISLEKVLEFDGSNRLGARELLESLPKHLNS
jgi:hypothetical protein